MKSTIIKSAVISFVITAFISILQRLFIRVLGHPALSIRVPGGEIVSWKAIGFQFHQVVSFTKGEDIKVISEISYNIGSFILCWAVLFAILLLLYFFLPKKA